MKKLINFEKLEKIYKDLFKNEKNNDRKIGMLDLFNEIIKLIEFEK